MSVNIFDLVDTWNDPAVNFRAIKMNVTNIASGAGSLLMEMLVGGATRMTLSAAGTLFVSNQVQSPGFAVSGGGGVNISATGLGIASDQTLRFSSTTSAGGAADVILRREAANELGMRNGVSPQAVRIYNTFTDASNYERGTVGWNTNVLELATDAVGTGVARNVRLRRSAATAEINSQGNWVASGQVASMVGTYTHGSSGTHLLLGSDASGIAQFTALGGGWNLLRFGGATSAFPAIKRNGNRLDARLADDSAFCGIGTSGLQFPEHAVTLSSAANYLRVISSDGSAWRDIRANAFALMDDTFLERDAAGIVAQRRSTTRQIFRIYNTYTNASNYERGNFGWDTNTLRISTEHAGTGLARPISFWTNGLERMRIAADGALTYGVQSTFDPPNTAVSLDIGEVSYGRFDLVLKDFGGDDFPDARLYMNPEEGMSVAANNASFNISASFSVNTPSSTLFLASTGASFDLAGAFVVNVVDTSMGLGEDGIYTTANEYILSTVATSGAIEFSFGGVDNFAFNGASKVMQVSHPGWSIGTAVSRFTNANIDNLYLHNSYNNASNWERGSITWASNTLRIGTERNGTGVARPISFWTNGLERMSLSADGGLSYGMQSTTHAPNEVVTITADDDGGTNQGFFNLTCRDYSGDDLPDVSLTLNPSIGALLQGGETVALRADSVVLGPIGSQALFDCAFKTFYPAQTGWSVGIASTSSRFTNANIDNLYLHNSYTNSTNWERGFVRWVSNAFEIATERNGTGSARPIIFRTNTVNRFTIGSAGTITAALAASQNFIITGLPTANPNVAGALWNDGGTLRVSAG